MPDRRNEACQQPRQRGHHLRHHPPHHLRQHHHRFRGFVGARLHRRLFLLMGVTIFLTLLVAAWVAHLTAPKQDIERRRDAIEAFAAHQFSKVWTSEQQRRSYAQEVASAFDVGLSLRDSQGRILERIDGGCSEAWTELRIKSLETPRRDLGVVAVCGFSSGATMRFRFLWILASAGAVLWLASGIIARRLGAPLWRLTSVTTRIGEGDLAARVRLGRHESGEVGMLAHSINVMAERIEKQMSDQKELLAGVSHEIRTPLARLRLIVEMLKERSGEQRLTEEAEREILEVDDLTSRLLASSRLEFLALELRDLDAQKLAKEALRRLDLDPGLLRTLTEDTTFCADPTLISRALINLLQNAQTHGSGVTGLEVARTSGGDLVFRVEDAGPGLSQQDLDRLTEPFVRGVRGGQAGKGGGLGLGLALVRRIARAHSGDLETSAAKPHHSAVVLRIARTQNPRSEADAEHAPT